MIDRRVPTPEPGQRVWRCRDCDWVVVSFERPQRCPDHPFRDLEPDQ
ncbi:hypothetical protein AB0K00_17935 [Dactylosporangium sp. NPDC049525]